MAEWTWWVDSVRKSTIAADLHGISHEEQLFLNLNAFTIVLVVLVSPLARAFSSHTERWPRGRQTNRERACLVRRLAIRPKERLKHCAMMMQCGASLRLQNGCCNRLVSQMQKRQRAARKMQPEGATSGPNAGYTTTSSPAK